MTSMIRRSLLGCGLAASLCALDTAGHVALVYNFLGDPLGAHARRGTETIRLSVVDPLYPGDRLSADPGGSFEIEYLNGVIVTVTSDTPHTVGAIRSASRSLDPIFKIELRDLWGRLGTLVGLSGETGPLRMAIPGLTSSQAQVSAGQRLIGLDWSGGVAPFSVTITGPSEAAVLSVTAIDQRAVATLAPRTLDPGPYQITIADSAGAVALGSFTAIGLSQHSQTSSAVYAGPRVAAALEARALAQNNPLVFGYEAYLQLLAIDPRAGDAPTVVDLFRLELSRQVR